MLHDLAREHTGGARPTALPLGFLGDGDAVLAPPRELVTGTLPMRGTGIIGGQSGAGKTFVGVELMIRVASGTPFMGRAIREPMGGAYLAAEGGGTIAARFAAAKKHAGIEALLPFTFSASVGNLMNDKDIDRAIANLNAVSKYFEHKFGVSLGLIIIDTASSAFCMRDENDNAEVARLCARLARIDHNTGAFTAVVHHFGKDQSAGLRGGSAFRANVDSVLACLAERNNKTGQCGNRRVIVEKNRDGVEGPVGGFDLCFVELGKDEEGQPYGSCGIEYSGKAKGAGPAEPASRRTFHAAFDEAAHRAGREHRVMDDGEIASPIVMAVPVTVVREEFYRRWATGESDGAKAKEARKKAFGRALRDTANRYGQEVVDAEELIWRL